MSDFKDSRSPQSTEALDRRAEGLVDAGESLLSGLVDQRRAHGYSLETVAERMAVSVQEVEEFERYDANPLLSSIIRYAMAVDAFLKLDVIDDCGNVRQNQ